MNNNSNRVLVVEDEPEIIEFISEALAKAGFAVTRANDGSAALTALTGGNHDVVVLDITLPGRDGLSVLRELRKQGDKTPVLLLSGRSAVHEKVEGLNSGADDYLSKPFALAELVARLRALTRGREQKQDWLLRVGDLTLDTRSWVASRGSRRIELTNLEFRLLEHLMRSPGRICERSRILEVVWERQSEPGSNVVDACMRKLRAKIDGAGESKLLHNERGVGFMIGEP